MFVQLIPACRPAPTVAQQHAVCCEAAHARSASPRPAKSRSQANRLTNPRSLASPWVGTAIAFRGRPYFDVRPAQRVAVQIRAEDASGEPQQEEESISKALRRSFLEACLPGQRPYVDALKEFITKGVEAYRRGYNLRALDLELSLAQDDTTGLNYSLAQDEQDMRTVWLSLIFLTCAKVGVSRPSDAVPPSDELKLSHFVDMVIAAFQKGYDLKRLQLEQRFASSSGLFGGGMGVAASPDAAPAASPESQAQKNVESAIVSQSMRIVFMALEAIFGRPAGGAATA